MIVDLDLRGARAVVVGAGNEALRRARALLEEGCSVTVIGERVDARLEGMAGERLEIRRERVADARAIRGCGARVVVAATSDAGINAEIVRAARAEPNCLAYSSDGASRSDYAHVATADLSPSVRVAVSTRGRSPVMAAALRDRAAAALGGLVGEEDEAMIDLQAGAREAARARLASPQARRAFLREVAADGGVKQLIKDGRAGAARDRAMHILEAMAGA